MMYRKENFITGMTYFPEIRSQRRKEKKPYQMRNVLGNKTPDEIRELCRLWDKSPVEKSVFNKFQEDMQENAKKCVLRSR